MGFSLNKRESSKENRMIVFNGGCSTLVVRMVVVYNFLLEKESSESQRKLFLAFSKEVGKIREKRVRFPPSTLKKEDEMKIRKARKEDFKEIARILIKESSKKPYNEKYNFKTAFKEILKFSKNEFYVAVSEKEIIGFIASSITSDNKEKAYINELWLKPFYQGKGIGKALVKFIEDKYKKKGVKIIRLVARRDAKAFDFYKKIKYKEYKKLVFMEKKI